MHFRDNTDRDGKQNQDVDGSAAHEVIEVDGGHEVSLEDHGRRPLSTCRRSAVTLMRSVCHPNRSLSAILVTMPRSGMAPRGKIDQPSEKFPKCDALPHTEEKRMTSHTMLRAN